MREDAQANLHELLQECSTRVRFRRRMRLSVDTGRVTEFSGLTWATGLRVGARNFLNVGGSGWAVNSGIWIAQLFAVSHWRA